MGMRKYQRSIAKANMERAGMKKVNRIVESKKDDKKRSLFAKKWRAFSE